MIRSFTVATMLVVSTSAIAAAEDWLPSQGFDVLGPPQYADVLPESGKCPLGGMDKCQHVAGLYIGTLSVRAFAEAQGFNSADARVISFMFGTAVSAAKEAADGVCQSRGGNCHMSSGDFVASMIGVLLAQVLPMRLPISSAITADRATYFDEYIAPTAGETMIFSTKSAQFVSDPRDIRDVALTEQATTLRWESPDLSSFSTDGQVLYSF